MAAVPTGGNNSDDHQAVMTSSEAGPEHVTRCAEQDDTFTKVQHSIVEAVSSADAFQSVRIIQPHINMKNSKGFTLLHSLLPLCNKQAERKTFLYVLKTAPQLCTEKTTVTSATPLCFACKNTLHTDLIKALVLENPATLNMQDSSGMSPLHYVCAMQGYLSKFHNPQAEEYKSLVQFMLEHGANANATDCNGTTLVQYLLQSEGSYRESEILNFTESKLKVIAELLEVLFKNGAHCSHETLKHVEDLTTTKTVLKYLTSDINIVDSNGWTCLHHILVNTQSTSEVIEFLIENGAKVEAEFNPTFDLAKKQCTFSITEAYLLENPDVISSCGNELLRLHCDNVDNVQRLLNLGADPNQLQHNNTSPLYEARKSPDVVKLLLDNGANPFQGFPQQTSFLFCVFREILDANTEDMPVLHEWYIILEFLLRLPQISSPDISPEICNMFNQCYDIVPGYFKSYKILHIKPRLETVFGLFNKINPRILMSVSPSQRFRLNNMEFESTSLDPIARILTVCLSYRTVDQSRFKKEDFVSFMLKCGFSIQSNNCVSVLTSFLMLQSDRGEAEREKIMVQELMCKLNVESMALPIDVTASLLHQYSNLTANYNINELVHIREILKVPDAILVSVLNKKIDITEILLPHWHGPPLALLSLHTVKVTLERNASTLRTELQHFIHLFDLVVKFGGVPHGTEMYGRLVRTMQQMIEYQLTATSEQQQNNFSVQMQSISDTVKQLTSSPLTLVELCKYVVRERVADTATCSDKSLPVLLHNLLPPLLRSVVIH